MIAFAKSFDGVSTDGTTFNSCLSFPAGTAFTSVKITSFDDGVTTFSCEKDPKTGTYGALASRSGALQPIYLIDTNTIDVNPCNFTCNQANLFSPITININMTLQKQVSSGFSESQTVIPFNTSVTLRNSP
jgi:ABC-type phosphate/phosphonate transport system substrate-binding protein